MVKEAQHHPPRRGQAPRDRGHPLVRLCGYCAKRQPAQPPHPCRAKPGIGWPGVVPRINTAGHGEAGRRPANSPNRHGPATSYCYFLFLRWMRVFLRSLRCFFLAILLRRFLMTEPTAPPSAILDGTGNRHASPPARHQGAGHSPGKDYRRPSLATDSSPTEAQRTHPAHSPQPAAWVWGSAPPGISSAATAQVPEGHRAALAASSPRLPLAASRIRHEGILQILIHGLLRYAKGTPHPDRLKLAGVDQTVDRHL